MQRNELPFAAGENWWAVDPVQNYAYGCALGRSYYEQATRYMEASGNDLAMLHILKAMIDGGKTGPIEIGFISCLG